VWSRNVPPVITIDSGDTVTFDTLDGSNGQITSTSTSADLDNFAIELADPVFGPVYIRGAEPGDALKVEFLALETATWGWTGIIPGFGLLADEFPDPHLKIWELLEGRSYAIFKPGIHIPLRPFLGQVGVAPGQEGSYPTVPPRDTGGNLDCRYLTAGTTLYLPVRVPGALFSCGDGHAAQGDGEVCGSAIETPLKATVRLTVCKDQPWVTSPHFQTKSSNTSRNDESDSYAVIGVDSDLREASRKGLRGLIEYLVRTRNLSRPEAYMLASVSADLKIVEAVDMPTYAVAVSIPLSIFCT
jgi:acetamidase/formamidase